jgi:hypothetical protein
MLRLSTKPKISLQLQRSARHPPTLRCQTRIVLSENLPLKLDEPKSAILPLETLLVTLYLSLI